MKVPKVEYEIYYPLNGRSLSKLDLSFCQNIKIDISIPINISREDIDKYNSSSGYYNDICYTLTTENGTDKILKDRQNDYIEKNMTICGENCEFSFYNDDYGKATCSCFIKINIPLMSEIKIDKDLLLSEFKNIKNIGNFDKLKCINLFFSSENFYKNSSNYLFIIMLILSLTTVFVFSLYSYLKIKNIIEEIYKSKISKNNNAIIKEKNKSKNKKINNIEGINNNDGSQMKIKENNFNVNTINNEDDIKNNIEEQKVKTDINKSIVFNMINYNNNNINK